MEFWQGKKVLLTGHTGFKGSWLSLWLQSLGVNLIGFSLAAPTTPNFFEITQVEKGMGSIIGDIRDFSLLRKTINHYQPEIVIHMAAQSLVRFSYQEPLTTYTTNVIGTTNLLETLRFNDSVQVVINVTSDKCYENKENNKGYCEIDRLGGYDPYSNSKACAELVTQAYYNSYFKVKEVGIATVRAGNVIGGGDWSKDRLVPDIMDACIHNKSIFLRYPHALRPWQHVLEPLQGYLLLAEKLYRYPQQYSGAWNFGPDEDDIKSVSWITDKFMRCWGHDKSWVFDKNSHPYESSLLKLDSTKSRMNLGWKSYWGIEQAISKTVQWYQAYENGKKMKDITVSQLKDFIQDSSLQLNTLKF